MLFLYLATEQIKNLQKQWNCGKDVIFVILII